MLPSLRLAPDVLSLEKPPGCWRDLAQGAIIFQPAKASTQIIPFSSSLWEYHPLRNTAPPHASMDKTYILGLEGLLCIFLQRPLAHRSSSNGGDFRSQGSVASRCLWTDNLPGPWDDSKSVVCSPSLWAGPSCGSGYVRGCGLWTGPLSKGEGSWWTRGRAEAPCPPRPPARLGLTHHFHVPRAAVVCKPLPSLRIRGM